MSEERITGIEEGIKELRKVLWDFLLAFRNNKNLEWIVPVCDKLLAKLDGEKTSAPLHPSPPLNTKPFTPKEEIDPELMKRIMSHEIEPMRKDGEKPLIMIMCNECDLYGECDHQGAYKKDGKWCYE